MINIFQPSLGEEELAAVEKVFKSNWIGKGAKTKLFEEKFLEHLQVNSGGGVVSVNSCTEGLFQVMKCFVESGDEVIMPTCSFVGAANAVVDRGARVVFCDVDKRSLNVTAKNIAEKISSKTKAVCILHFGGVPCEMDEIIELCAAKNIILIEDSATAVSSSYKGKACGTFGEAATWSFDAMKILVCGDGGMIYAKDKEKLRALRQNIYLGLVSQSGFTNSVDSKWWEFQIDTFGRRSIMNDISSAIGLVQLEKLPGYIAKRKHVAEIYDSLLENVDWLERPPALKDYQTSSYYMYHVQTKLPEDRDRLAAYLRGKNIYTTFRYYPLHWVDLYGQKSVHLPNAEIAALSTLCLPIHQSLSDEEVEFICREIISFKR